MYDYIGGGFQRFVFSPLPGEMIQFEFDEHIFQLGWFPNHQLEVGTKPPTRFPGNKKTLQSLQFCWSTIWLKSSTAELTAEEVAYFRITKSSNKMPGSLSIDVSGV